MDTSSRIHPEYTRNTVNFAPTTNLNSGGGSSMSRWTQIQQEWQNSAVDPQITRLNVKHLTLDTPREYLLYALPEHEWRRNNGTVRNKYRKQYAHTEHGGWWCSTVDVLAAAEGINRESEWGCLKPFQPRSWTENGKTKVLKYEHPLKASTELFALRITYELGLKIAKRYRLGEEYGKRILQAYRKRQNTPEARNKQAQSFNSSRELSQKGNSSRNSPDQRRVSSSNSVGVFEEIALLDLNCQDFLTNEDPLFWHWVIKHPQIPITITEGAKKAAALLSNGYCAIGLPGIYGGYRTPKDEFGKKIWGASYLIPQLEVFATNSRPFYFAFDQDTKPKTVTNVNTAIKNTGKLLQAKGCPVNVTRWSNEHKGVDDLIVAQGTQLFDIAYFDALSLKSWEAIVRHQLTYPINPIINQKYLGDLSELGITYDNLPKFLAIQSAKGTGKTHSIAELAALAQRVGQKILVLTHRIQLGLALCNIFGIDYVSEFRNSETGGVFGYGLCVDSLHSKSLARFNPEEWSDALIIIDEVEQVIWHMLDSTTCQKERVAILENFKTLIGNVLSDENDGNLIVADADLSDISLNYLSSLGHGRKPRLIVNNYKPHGQESYIVYNYNDTTPANLVNNLIKAIARGEKVFIQLSAQKAKSKWGTKNMEAFLKKEFQGKNLKTLRIDSETIAEPGHPAFGIIPNLNEELSNYDVVICSPSIETGVSIDIKGHFNSVWIIAQGVQTCDGVRQSMMRVRENIPRHLWAAPRGLSQVGSGEKTFKGLISSQHKLTKANINLLTQVGADDLEAGVCPKALSTWAERGTLINQEMADYRTTILAMLGEEGQLVMTSEDFDDDLREEGHKVTEEEDKEFEEEAVYQKIKLSKQKVYDQHCEQIANADDIDNKRYEQLKDQRAKTEQERLEYQKAKLRYRYDLNVTPLLVKEDDDGLYRSTQLLYYATVGWKYLPERERKLIENFKQESEGKIFNPDFNRSMLSAKVFVIRKLLPLSILSDNERELRNADADLIEMAELAKKFRWDVKRVLGITVNPDASPIKVLRQILDKLGLSLKLLRKEGSRGEQVRIYQLKRVLSLSEQVQERWLLRDDYASESVVTETNNKSLTNSGDYAGESVVTETNNKSLTNSGDY
ncbi:MAG: plasmid replication protein, CyRepA1 family, partial [Oscillatoria sp. PMC 1068.18]|nr:plasmid replication protein, CyRepA1 family [Oscillatoria sp. PMC 1068.18]